MNRIYRAVVLILLASCVMTMFAGCKKKSYLSSSESKVEDKETSIEDSDSGHDTDASGDIYVQVSGAVVKPGVYKLKSDDRVYKAIEAAGGLREDAEDTDINQAAKLSDGSKLTVKTKAEVISQQALADEDSLVNINTADVNRLCSLSGIGEAKAQGIIKYRNSNGGFNSIEDIKKVSGIGDGLYSKIEDSITV